MIYSFIVIEKLWYWNVGPLGWLQQTLSKIYHWLLAPFWHLLGDPNNHRCIPSEKTAYKLSGIFKQQVM